jgi:6-phosphogluconolactonase
MRRRLCVASALGDVSLYELDAESGKIELWSSSRIGERPSCLALHRRLAVGYVALEAAAEIVTLALSGTRFGVLGRAPSGGGGPVHLTLDRESDFLLCANSRGGTVSVIALHADGTLGKTTYTGAAGEEPRSIAVDRSNRFVFVPARGSDRILCFRFDRSRGVLHPLPEPLAATPARGGPGNVAFHPTLPILYVSSERSSEIACFALDVELGGLSERQVLSSLSHAFEPEHNRAGDLHVARSGRFLYTSNRGHDSIAVFGIRADGTLSLLGHAAALGKSPRSFALSPSGDLLVAANQESDCLTTFRLDTGSGVLTALDSTNDVPAPRWVGFL